MTKALGPKHKPDLWKVRAKSQVFSTAGLSAPPALSLHLFSFFHDTPPFFLYFPLPLLLSLPVSLQSMLSLCQTDFLFQKGEIKVLDEKGEDEKEGKH